MKDYPRGIIPNACTYSLAIIYMNIVDKIPPQSLEAERAVLGSMLIEQPAIVKSLLYVTNLSFYDINHRLIFNAIVDLYKQGKSVDFVTVAEVLRGKKQLKTVGGAKYLADLIDSVATAANVQYYAEIVRDKYIRRELGRLAYELYNKTYDEDKPLDKLITDFRETIFKLSEQMIDKKFNLKESLHDLFDYLEDFGKKHKGLISTGWNNLDYKLGGLMRKMVYTIGGRPSMGKTSFLIALALKILFQHCKVLFLSLEMSKNRILSRMITATADVSNRKVMGLEEQTDEERSRIYQAGEQLSHLNFVVGEYCYTIDKIIASVEEHKPDVIILDYIQNMQYSKTNIPQEIAVNMASLKRLAMEKDLIVLNASQVDRSMDYKKAKDYRMNVLKGSGGIEESSDVVMFAVWSNKDEEDFELVIDKNKITGPTGILNFKFRRDYGTFEEV